VSDTRIYKRAWLFKRKTDVKRWFALDNALCQILNNLYLLRYITPLNAEYWKKRYLAGEPLSSNPQFVYRDEEIKFTELKNKLNFIKPEDEVSMLLFKKAREAKLFFELIEARNSSVFRDISRRIYGSVDNTLLQKAYEWLKLPVGSPTRFHYDVIAAKEKLEKELASRNLNVAVKLRKYLTSKAAAGIDTIGLKASASFSDEDFKRIIAHEVETHILRKQNGLQQPLKSLFFHGFPRTPDSPGGYLKTDEGLALFSEEVSGILTSKRKRIIAARVLAIYLMDRQGLNFNEVFEILVREHNFKPATAFDVCERTFRAGGFTKDQIYLRGYEEIKEFCALRSSDMLLLYTGKIALDWLALLKKWQEDGLVNPPVFVPKWVQQIKFRNSL